MKTSLRDIYCGELRKKDVGKTFTLCGWVRRVRDMGGMVFLDLRDQKGYVQCLVEDGNPFYHPVKALGMEDCIQVKGVVQERKDKNPEIPTGDIEVVIKDLKLFTRAKEKIPFLIDDKDKPQEETKLKYRFLDLRRNRLHNAIILRHKVVQTMREFLNNEGFIEIETPYLARSTPEGARDFLVPSRIHPKKFYALPQSPQLYKQVLMTAGFDRYYQFARCFRDEDLRKDRQPEFTQLDIEMSFIEEEDIFALVEYLFQVLFKKILNVEIDIPFSRITYKESISKYGSDKPNLTVNWEFQDVTGLVKKRGIRAFEKAEKVLALVMKEIFLSRKKIEELDAWLKESGGKGTIFIKKVKNSLSGFISKFFKAEDFPSQGTYLLIGDTQDKVITLGGMLRERLADEFQPKNKFSFLWITNFPFYVWDTEGAKWEPSHHPFTQPEDPENIDKNPQELIARSYDLILNGQEIASGSIRIHSPELQKKILEKMGYSIKEIEERFGFFLNALEYGTPPHGGIALGLERIVALIGNFKTIRDVIAFPKTARGYALFEGAPSAVSKQQLKELRIQIKK